MATIGIRELRQNASAYLRRVAAGEILRVADRGRPIALLRPLQARRGVARLEDEGRLKPAAGDLLALGPPLRVLRSPGVSRTLALAREYER
jgi:prevent-host-death family protein